MKARYLIPAFVALAFMIYGAFVSTRNTRENIDDFRQVAHSRAVLLNLQRLQIAVQELVVCQRGYVVTGNLQYMESYAPSLVVVDSKLEELLNQTSDNPRQQVRLGMVKELLLQKEAELQRVIDARKNSGFNAAAALVGEGRGRQLLTRLTSILEELEEVEIRLLEKRQAKMMKSFSDTNVTVLTANAVAIIAGITGTVLLGLYLVSRDRQDKLHFEKEKAVQADQAKSEFLAMMSHEIRTPMNAILGFGELLEDSVQQPHEKHYAQAIVSSGNSLLSLINDILDLSKIEAAKLDIHPEVVDVKRFMESIHTLFSFRAEEKGLQYSVKTDASVPEYLIFDALRVRQVLINLVGNAVKFTREGGVQVRASCSPQKDGELELKIEVEDTGIGISEESKSEIFRPFFQVESLYGRNYQGTGLGLSISQRLAQLMGGKIDVRSELGKGSIFSAVFPVGERLMREELISRSPGEAKHIDFNSLAPSKVLVVDDVPLNRELIRGYLSGSHHEIIEAENGDEAVRLCRRHLPDIVLMDIRMPMLDGKSALNLLRQSETTRQIPLIAVTASSLLNSQDELKSIFDGFASKPISRDRLFQELEKFIRPHQPENAIRPVVEETSDKGASSHRVVKDVSQLKEKLEQLKITVWPNLSRLVPAQGTLNFAKQLSTLASTHDCNHLAVYASELENAAKTMNFQEAGRLLADFPAQIEGLSRYDV